MSPEFAILASSDRMAPGGNLRAFRFAGPNALRYIHRMGMYATDITLDCHDSTGAHDLRNARWPFNGEPGRFQIMDAFIGYGSPHPAPPGWLVIGSDRIMRDGHSGAIFEPPPPDNPNEPRAETLNFVMSDDTDGPAYDLLIRPLAGGKVDLLVFDYDTAPDY